MPAAVLKRKHIDPTLPIEEQKRLLKVERQRLRAAARRHQDKVDQILEEVYRPLDEWDEEELARGRPKDSNGKFRGAAPSWVSRAMHEQAISIFTDTTKGGLRGLVPKAIRSLDYILTCEELDEKGRPMVPPGVRLDAAKWVVEHLVGKPTQRIEADVSVKLQGILAQVMVSGPGGEESAQSAMRGLIEAQARESQSVPSRPRKGAAIDDED